MTNDKLLPLTVMVFTSGTEYPRVVYPGQLRNTGLYQNFQMLFIDWRNLEFSEDTLTFVEDSIDLIERKVPELHEGDVEELRLVWRDLCGFRDEIKQVLG